MGTLTALQERVLGAFRDLDETYLTGGAALGHFYLEHRGSLDLDLFSPTREALEEAEAALVLFCAEHGLLLVEERRYPGFRRFRVRDGDETTLVDLVVDPVPQTVAVAEKPVRDGLRIDALADILANKLGALLGRGDPKDLVYLYFADAAGHDSLAHWEAATARDGGLEPATLAFVLASMPLDTSTLLMARPVDAERLAEFRDLLVRRLRVEAFPRR